MGTLWVHQGIWDYDDDREMNNDCDDSPGAGEVDDDGDGDPDNHPGHTEACDGMDNNRDGVGDEGVLGSG